MSWILKLLRPIYFLLYHQFAWTYDFVSFLVSLGHWREWVLSAVSYLDGRVLEIGFGPGHLQQILIKNKFAVYGLDDSRQMAVLAQRRIRKQGAISRLIRGYAQFIPFPNNTFNTVVATFPSDYIFSIQTLDEIKRVLTPDGKIVILPMAWITGKNPLERFTAWLLRITGETPGKPAIVSKSLINLFSQNELDLRIEFVNLISSQLLVLTASKKPNSSLM